MTGHADSMRDSAATRAEAAAWIARLRGPNRSPEVEDGLRRWLNDDPAHAHAFERLTETWEKSARLSRRPAERLSGWNLSGFRISFSGAALAVASCCVVAVLVTSISLRSDSLTTGVGELRTLSLEDGTRVHLNTATRLRVHYTRARRDVRLEQGEAFFEVAHRPDRPFVVSASGRQIRALGTRFVVRTDSHDLIVTLVQGKVDVSPEGKEGDLPAQASGLPSHTGGATATSTFTLAPGERLTFAPAQMPKIDWPALEAVTAWERGQVSFDNTTLGDAANELNRYSRRHIVFSDAATASIKVSGVFATGDSANFARAVAHAFNLKVSEEPSEIRLLPEPVAGKVAAPQ